MDNYKCLKSGLNSKVNIINIKLELNSFKLVRFLKNYVNSEEVEISVIISS